MKIKVYKEGCGDDAEVYETTIQAAVEAFPVDDRECARRDTVNLIVEPLDDEARALGGWHSDEDSPAYRMFVVTARREITWTANEVATFNSRAATGTAS
jgi:hypothetical protein